jgi:hypothetical protein
MSCLSALPSALQKGVFVYPKQRATVLVGSVLKWRARPQCLRRQQSVFAYPKQRATVSVGSVLKWRARPQCLRRRSDFVLQMNNTIVTRPQTIVKFRPPSSLDYRTLHGEGTLLMWPWLDATRRYSTLFDATRRYLTLLDATRRYSTLLDATRRFPF